MKDIKEEMEKLYLELQKEADFRVGDRVKVLRAAESWENGWQEVWDSEIKDKFVGKTFKIRDVSKWGISLRYGEGALAWHFPYFILEREQTYHIGQHFLYNNNDEYLLANIHGNKISLFRLTSGNKWSDAIDVLNINKITEYEMKRLANRLGQWKGFKLIEE